MRITPGLSSFYVAQLSSSTRSGGAISSIGVCGSPVISRSREPDRIQIFWAVTGDPRYSGYKAPTRLLHY
jgi:hypothetical protein